jgi:hypothetical protein
MSPPVMLDRPQQLDAFWEKEKLLFWKRCFVINYIIEIINCDENVKSNYKKNVGPPADGRYSPMLLFIENMNFFPKTDVINTHRGNM